MSTLDLVRGAVPSFRMTVGLHAALFLVGITVTFALDGGYAYGVVVIWVVALAITALIGLGGLIVGNTRSGAAGVLAGTVLAIVFEFILSLAIALIWLHFNPEFELS